MHLLRKSKLCVLASTHRGKRMFASLRPPSSWVVFKQFGKAAVITLDRPKALNAYSREMSASILKKLTEFCQDDSIELVCMKSAGGRAFCAGGDIVSLSGFSNFIIEDQMHDLLAHYPKPFVAFTDGISFGGGMGLAVNGAITVATEKSLFAMPETLIGYFPDAGASYFLSRVPNSIGMYMALSGARITGSDAKHLGLASHYTSSSTLNTFLSDSIPELNQKNVNQLLYSLEEELPVFSLEEHVSTISECFSAPSVQEIIARLHKDKSKFASQTLATLAKMSPKALCVTYKMQIIAAHLPFRDCMRMEYDAAAHMFQTNELKEGVRALLVDKDRNPQWDPPTLDLVTDEMVDRCFQACESEPAWQPKV